MIRRPRVLAVTEEGTAKRFHKIWVIALLAALSMIGLMVCGLEPAQYLAISLLMGVAGQRLFAMFEQKGDVFAPLNLLAVYFLVNFAIRAVYVFLDPSAGRVGRLYYDDAIPLALVYATVGFLSFWAGTNCGLPRHIGQKLSPKLPGWGEGVPAFRVLALYACGVAGALYLFAHGARTVGNLQQDILNNKYNPMPGFIVLMAGLINVGCTATAAFLLARRSTAAGRLSCWLVLLLGVAFITVQFCLTGKKTNMLEPLVAFIIIYHYLKNRMSFRRITMVGLPLFLLSFGVLNIYRYSIIDEAGGAPRSLADLPDRISYAIEYFHSGRANGFGGTSVLSFMEREFGVDSLALVVKYTPDRKPFGLGERYLGIPAQILIPRQLWPDKPIDYFTGEFEDAYVVGWKDSYTSPHVISDLYENFHVFGIVAGMFSIGIVLQSLYNTCSPWLKQPAGVFIYAALMPGLIEALEWEPVAVCQFYGVATVSETNS